MKEHPDHSENLMALRRIEGQVRGVQKMIEERKYCVDIINQIYAVRGALAQVEDKILKRHFEHCVQEVMDGRSHSDKETKLNELFTLIHRTRKI
ncbi:MAG: metal-sensitive transcriptional regulator [Candidatus Omnitrophica bacterium]|nr:metal-sensitive transcriptional regulator [Candidatus Omnitrophota bacterium]